MHINKVFLVCVVHCFSITDIYCLLNIYAFFFFFMYVLLAKFLLLLLFLLAMDRSIVQIHQNNIGSLYLVRFN